MQKASVFSDSPINLSSSQDYLVELVIRAKQNQDGAFSEIYDLYFKKIYTFIYYRVSHKEIAEDLTEEVFIKIYEKISKLSDPRLFEGWLYQISRNRVIDYYRQKKTLVSLEEVENTLVYESNILDTLHLKDQQKTLLRLLSELTPEQQTIIKLKFLEDLSNEEISQIVKKSEGAIRVIQHRGIAKLQELIKNLPSY